MLCGYLPVFGKRLGGVARNILEFFIRLGKVSVNGNAWQSLSSSKCRSFQKVQESLTDPS